MQPLPLQDALHRHRLHPCPPGTRVGDGPDSRAQEGVVSAVHSTPCPSLLGPHASPWPPFLPRDRAPPPPRGCSCTCSGAAAPPFLESGALSSRPCSHSLGAHSVPGVPVTGTQRSTGHGTRDRDCRGCAVPHRGAWGARHPRGLEKHGVLGGRSIASRLPPSGARSTTAHGTRWAAGAPQGAGHTLVGSRDACWAPTVCRARSGEHSRSACAVVDAVGEGTCRHRGEALAVPSKAGLSRVRAAAGVAA